jgi:hypothetical protein
MLHSLKQEILAMQMRQTPERPYLRRNTVFIGYFSLPDSNRSRVLNFIYKS